MTLRSIRFRATALLGSALAGALLLAGCASAQPEAIDSTAAREGLLPPAEGAVEYPLTLESPFGDTVLAERPERIAAVHPSAADTELLLALGVTPQLSSSILSAADSLVEFGAADIETFDFVAGEPLPVEAIAASQPDLIVAVGWDSGGAVDLSEVYEQLAAVAPVVTNPTYSAEKPPWQESIRALGNALDLLAAAEDVITADQEFFQQIREDNADFADLTLSWTIWYGSDWGPLTFQAAPGTTPSAFFASLGFKPNPNAENFADETRVSDENLSQVDADVLVVAQNSDDEDFATLTERTLFQNLGAVQSGRFVTFKNTDDVGNLPFAIATSGPLSGQWAAELLVPRVRAVL